MIQKVYEMIMEKHIKKHRRDALYIVSTQDELSQLGTLLLA